MTALAPRYPAETTLIDRVARKTGTRVLLVYNWDADPEQPWETICGAHGGVCSHETRALAEQWLPHPDEWCEDCAYGPGTLAGKTVGRFRVMGRSGPLGRGLDRAAADALAAVSGGTVEPE